MIRAQYVYFCECCDDCEITEHDGIGIGDRPPAAELPLGWNGVETGRLLCPTCVEESVPRPDPEIVLT